MSTSLAPSLLLSMPQLLDPNFSRTVILLCKHNDDGAFGLVVNRPLVATGRVVLSLDPVVPDHTIGTPHEMVRDDLEVWVGGPVEPERSWILVHGAGEGEYGGGMAVADGVTLSTSPALLQRLLAPSPPHDARLVVGYSGWGPGQLEAELRASAWLIGEVDCDLIFKTPADRMWETAIRRLGADPAALQMSRGVH
ncbi:MAG: YqgE/AlgH family protein [Acidobacteriota bacterium]